jgi:hypothetical protein
MAHDALRLWRADLKVCASRDLQSDHVWHGSPQPPTIYEKGQSVERGLPVLDAAHACCALFWQSAPSLGEIRLQLSDYQAVVTSSFRERRFSFQIRRNTESVYFPSSLSLGHNHKSDKAQKPRVCSPSPPSPISRIGE